MLPTFLHVGAAKCASTWLYRTCLEHPGISVPPDNDNVNFFLSHYHRGLDWYRRTYFTAYAGEPVAGEFSNGYMLSDIALERIAAELPGVKLTMTVREPVERAYINWAYEKRKRKWTPEQGVRIDMVFHPNRWQFFRQWVEPSLYGAALQRILRFFEPGRVLVLFLEDLTADPRAFLGRFFDFVGADPEFVPTMVEQRINDDQQNESLACCPAELRTELSRATRSDVLQLQELTGRDLSHWLDRHRQAVG